MIDLDGIRIYPLGKHPYGQDIIGASAMFDGADVIISLMDAWVMQPQNIPPSVKWFPWFPIDCEPMPVNVLEVVRKARKGIVMSKFGQRMAQLAKLDTFYVPHGVDTNAYRPLDRAAARKRLQWPTDKFIVGMVAANKGIPPRKSFFEQIAAFAALRALYPDVMLYLHTDDGAHGGEAVNLLTYCDRLGLKCGYQRNGEVAPDVDVLFAEQFTYLLGLPDMYMIDVYNALDVLMNVSMGEGFGIPIVEAQACGCPVIVGDWTSMGELCFGGWKIKKSMARQVWHPHFEAWQWSVNTDAVAERLDTAYQFRDNQDYRNRARDGALQYDADKVTEKYWKPALEEMAGIVK
jgi:glycosyltransferase involved in cell wall biosynthesis